jgi:Zn-dependent protease with chaperone function
LQPLWVRVDENRFRLGVFVVLYVAGSALLLTSALVAVPGSLAGVLLFEPTPPGYWHTFLIVWAASFGVLLVIGALFAAIQLSNAEHWVRGRMLARDLRQGEAEGLVEAVNDMSIAAGLAQVPRIAVTSGGNTDVNAFALGTTRTQPLIGVTPGFLSVLTRDEQRAVVAVLIARIIAGDIMFGTALAALMGPIKAVRESPGAMDKGCTAALGGKSTGEGEEQRSSGCDPGCALDGCGDGCGDLDEGIGGVVIVLVIAAITYLAVLAAAWIVTLWGRVLQRTAHEKADAEGMLLLKDPAPMLSAFRKTARASNKVADCDPSYDGIFYTATSGMPRIEKVEQRRYRRLREVVGVEGLAAEELETGGEDGTTLSAEEWAMQQLAPPEPLGPQGAPPEQPSEPPGPPEPPRSGT